MLRTGTKVKIQHTANTHEAGLKSLEEEPEWADLNWCNLGWRPCKGYVAEYGTIFATFRKSVDGEGVTFYVVKMEKHVTPSRYMVFRKQHLHQVEEFPPEGQEELFLPQH